MIQCFQYVKKKKRCMRCNLSTILITQSKNIYIQKTLFLIIIIINCVKKENKYVISKIKEPSSIQFEKKKSHAVMGQSFIKICIVKEINSQWSW